MRKIKIQEKRRANGREREREREREMSVKKNFSDHRPVWESLLIGRERHQKKWGKKVKIKQQQKIDKEESHEICWRFHVKNNTKNNQENIEGRRGSEREKKLNKIESLGEGERERGKNHWETGSETSESSALLMGVIEWDNNNYGQRREEPKQQEKGE